MTQFEIKKKKIRKDYDTLWNRKMQPVQSFYTNGLGGIFLLTDFKPNSKIATCKTVRQRYIYIFGRCTQNLNFI